MDGVWATKSEGVTLHYIKKFVVHVLQKCPAAHYIVQLKLITMGEKGLMVREISFQDFQPMWS